MLNYFKKPIPDTTFALEFHFVLVEKHNHEIAFVPLLRFNYVLCLVFRSESLLVESLHEAYGLKRKT